MKVQHVALCPAPEAKDCIALPPELMCACGARYSRNDEGIEEIVSHIDWSDPGKSVENIFKLADYGHSSVYDMAPVPIFMDGISVLAAFWLWHFCPKASGQESSTRYIRFNDKKMCKSSDIGVQNIEASQHSAYLCYEKSELAWSELARRDPSVMKIPPTVLADTSEKGVKKIGRLRRNYAFDRARVFLPLSARTNVMMVQSGRDWVDLCSLLFSSPFPELQQLASEIREALKDCVPRMLRHAEPKNSSKMVWEKRATLAKDFERQYKVLFSSHGGNAIVRGNTDDIDLKLFEQRENRYGIFEDSVRLCTIDMSWEQASIGEIRDLNRHRTGSKSLGPAPNGFMPGADQHQDMADTVLEYCNGPMRENYEKCMGLLAQGDLTGYYHLSLGHTFPWRQVTTLDKAIYTIELRTGVGAHYAYARMMKELLNGHSFLRTIMAHAHIGEAEPE